MSGNALFPPRAQRRSSDNDLTALLAAAEERTASGAVTPDFDRDAFAAELAAFDFAQPMPLTELLAWTVAQMEHGLVHTTHPRYLGLFNPAPSFPAQCADRIAASFNPQLATHATSPTAVAIEAHVIRAVARRARLPAESSGHFTSGGSEANGTALICALTRAEPGFAAEGSRAFRGRPTIYVSRDSHLAWIKLAHMAGMGRAAARFVATDGTGRMSPIALGEAIARDREAGCVPVMVVATAGTTNAGMIDPLAACGDIARREGAWFHVDAAWGGGAIASERCRDLLAGIQTADSVTIDAHKWFAATMGCGMFLTAHPHVLSAAFNVSANFMPSQARDLDPYLSTTQWSRRFLGLRLFLSLGAGGWAAHGTHVERAIELAQCLAEQATQRSWLVANQPLLAVVCLEPPAGSPPVRDIVKRVLDSGQAWVSAAQFEGREVVRCCVTHGDTSRDDIDAVVQLLDEAAHALPPAAKSDPDLCEARALAEAAEITPPSSKAGLVALFARISGKWERVILPANERALDKANRAPAFYCVHSLSGAGGTDFQHLAKLMPGVRFFGLQAPPTKMRDPAFGATVASIAAYYANTLVEFQPAGPFMLGGWSAGAIIALEIAQILRGRGCTVSLLAAFDMAPRNSGAALKPWHPVYLAEWAGNLPGWIHRDAVMMKRPLGQLAWRGIAKLFALAKAVMFGRRGTAPAKVGDLDKFMDVSYFPPDEKSFMERLYAAVLTYRPRNYEGSVVAYEATTKPLLDLPQVGRVWSRLAPRSIVVRVRGTHLSILQPGDVDALAADLRQRIADASEPVSGLQAPPPPAQTERDEKKSA